MCNIFIIYVFVKEYHTLCNISPIDLTDVSPRLVLLGILSTRDSQSGFRSSRSVSLLHPSCCDTLLSFVFLEARCFVNVLLSPFRGRSACKGSVTFSLPVCVDVFFVTSTLHVGDFSSVLLHVLLLHSFERLNI